MSFFQLIFGALVATLLFYFAGVSMYKNFLKAIRRTKELRGLSVSRLKTQLYKSPFISMTLAQIDDLGKDDPRVLAKPEALNYVKGYAWEAYCLKLLAVEPFTKLYTSKQFIKEKGFGEDTSGDDKGIEKMMGFDQGGDLIKENYNPEVAGELLYRTVIQCKHYSEPVDGKAVQQAVASMAPYRASKAIVMTNSTFTEAAKQLARLNGVELIGRPELAFKIAHAGNVPLIEITQTPEIKLIG